MIQQNRHEFAVFTGDSIPFSAQKREYDLIDKDLFTRLSTVLRARSGDRYIFFNDTDHARAEVVAVEKRKIRILLEPAEKNRVLMPTIEWIVPLLEREAFEAVITNLTVLGAATIQPVVTRKTHRTNFAPKELERTKRLMIAAAEQSKQFMLPEIKPLISIQDLRSSLMDAENHIRLFFDPDGTSSYDMIMAFQGSKATHLTCMVGPEGDLMSDEKELLKSLNFRFCALTQSILRAELAVVVSMGILRSLVR